MAKVLLVDDNDINRELLTEVLSSQGHEVLEASHGAQALAVLRAEQPALLISDVLMPSMDGYELVRQIRDDPALARIEVIFHTAHFQDDGARELARACGVTRWLLKPCTPEEILAAVGDALDSAPAPAPALAVDADFDREHLRVLTDKLSHKVDELAVANQRLSALIELNVHLASEFDPASLLERVCRQARHLFAATYAVVCVRERTDGAPEYVSTAGIDAVVATQLPRPDVDVARFRSAISHNVPLRQRDLGGDPVAAGLPAGYPPAHNSLMAPITSLARTHGWICLVDKVGAEAFTDEDERLLGTLAAQTGRIYENRNLVVELRRYAAQLQFESADRQRAIVNLGESEQRFRQLAENIRDVFFLTNADNTKVLYVSPAYEEISGRSCASLYAKPDSWLGAIHPEDKAGLIAGAQGRVASGSAHFEYRIVRPDGSIRWIRARGFPIRDESGEVYRIAGLAEDITERRQAEDRIRRLNRVHAVLSGINALIVRVRTRDELFSGACRIAVEQGLLRFAWIGLLELGARELKPMASAGPDPRLDGFDPLAHSDTLPAGSSLVYAAARMRRTIVCNDTLAFDATRVDSAVMRERGLRAAAAFPLASGRRVFGVLALYADERGFFDAEELHLLDELAGDIVFALEHIEKEERLHYLAYYDALTNLANRELFQERLAQAVSAAAHGHRRLAVVTLDIERFKFVNDTYGRAAGDDLLRLLALRLTECLGGTSELGRIAADQFAIIMTEAENDGEVLRQLQRWTSACFSAPFHLEKAELRVAARAGIALYPIDGSDGDALLANAEAALHKAKAGGDRHRFYTQQITERVAQKVALESLLRRALDDQEFVLHYQPVVSVATRRLVGLEALLRWQSPELGLVQPGHFMALLEETGLIVAVGAWTLQQAVRDRGEWARHHADVPRVSVNLSAIELSDPHFVESTRQALSADGSAPGGNAGIDFEVTESRVMENVLDHITQLEALRGFGANLAIDDFGTGYSSLAYLARLPVQTLKIDQSFVQTMLDEPSTMTLVQTMISLAHSLRLRVVAEGVETEDQARILRLLRCDEMQGFLISQAVPGPAVAALLVAGVG